MQSCLSWIDGATAKRDGKASVEVASSLYLAPKAAVHTKPLLLRLMEQQTHLQARTALCLRVTRTLLAPLSEALRERALGLLTSFALATQWFSPATACPSWRSSWALKTP